MGEYDIKQVHSFLMAFKQNSALLINNFMRRITKEQYYRGEAHQFDYMTGDVTFDDWDDPIEQLRMINCINNLNSHDCVYWPIDEEYISKLKSFANFMAEQNPLRNEMTVYRGCNSLDIDGVNGLVSSSKSLDIAKQFNRGTLLKIHLPKGMKYVDVEKTRLKNKSKDKECELILPPCDYKIISDEIIDLKGPNNPSGKTRMVEIKVTPRDLLSEFEKSMMNPLEEYLTSVYEKADEFSKGHYSYVFQKLHESMIKRTIDSFDKSKKVRGTGLYGQTNVIKRDGMYGTSKRKSTNMSRCFELMNSNEKMPTYMYEQMRQVNSSLTRTKQITPVEFYNYIKNSKDRHVFFDYENTDEHIPFYKHEDHGIIHPDNVTMFTYYIAEKEGYSKEAIRVLLEAARNHDIGRETGFDDPNHGVNGLQKYRELYGESVPPNENVIVGFLILAHSLPDTNTIRRIANQVYGKFLDQSEIDRLCDMANILRDADALDRTRFPIFSRDYLDSKYLTHDSAKELIEVAQTINYREKEMIQNRKRRESVGRSSSKKSGKKFNNRNGDHNDGNIDF